jgi:hypothetical protein
MFPVAYSVDGHAYLENQTDHSGIEVFFQRVAPDTLFSYTTYTDSLGYYYQAVESGFYDLTFSRSGFFPFTSEDVSVFSEQTLTDITLESRTGGEISGILEAGTYIIADTLKVAAGDTLTIKPGTVLKFNAGIPFIIKGLLHAVGESDNKITFTSNETVRWKGLDIYSCDPNSILKNCIIEESITGIYTGVNGMTMDGLDISNNGYGIRIYQLTDVGEEPGHDSISIINCRINYNSTGLDLTIFPIIQNYKLTVSNCELSSNTEAIHSYSGGLGYFLEIQFVNSVFVHNTFVAYLEDGGGFYAKVYYSNCVISDNEYIYEDMAVITVPSPDMLLDFKIENSALYNNNPFLLREEINPYIGDIVTTNANGDPCDVYNNISLDPKFGDPWAGGYWLTSDSPCIDAGTNTIAGYTFPVEDLGSCVRIWDGDSNGSPIVDMGAYEYGAPVGIEEQSVEVHDFTLYQNYPNPFNPLTTISYTLPGAGNVELSVYNLQGQIVQSLVNGNQDKGVHKAEFNGADLTSGMYIYSLKIDGKTVQSRKMMFLK